MHWRSLMTLLYWEWNLIPTWLLRSIFARFQEQFLKDMVYWGRSGDCSLIVRFLRYAFGILHCQFWSTVLQCRARLPIHTLNYWTVQSVVPVSNWGCVECDIAHRRSAAVRVCGIRSGVTRCPLLMMLHLCLMCQWGLHAVLWSHIGTPMYRLALEPRSTARLLLSWTCPSRTILLTPYSMVCDCGFQEQGQCFCNGLSCSIPTIVNYLFPFLFFLSLGWYCGAGVFGLIRCISLSGGLALQTSFSNNNHKTIFAVR